MILRRIFPIPFWNGRIGDPTDSQGGYWAGFRWLKLCNPVWPGYVIKTLKARGICVDQRGMGRLISQNGMQATSTGYPLTGWDLT